MLIAQLLLLLLLLLSCLAPLSRPCSGPPHLLRNILHNRASARQLLGLNLEAADRARPIRLEPLLNASCQPPASPAALGQIT
jgi:hypothetical protein